MKVGRPNDPILRNALNVLLWMLLGLGLPLALFACLALPNEYEVTLGINALDCDGPEVVMSLAIPALLLYGFGFVVSAVQWRRRTNLIVAALCLIVCIGVGMNFAHAIEESLEQADSCSV